MCATEFWTLAVVVATVGDTVLLASVGSSPVAFLRMVLTAQMIHFLGYGACAGLDLIRTQRTQRRKEASA